MVAIQHALLLVAFGVLLFHLQEPPLYAEAMPTAAKARSWCFERSLADGDTSPRFAGSFGRSSDWPARNEWWPVIEPETRLSADLYAWLCEQSSRTAFRFTRLTKLQARHLVVFQQLQRVRPVLKETSRFESIKKAMRKMPTKPQKDREFFCAWFSTQIDVTQTVSDEMGETCVCLRATATLS